MKLKLYHDRPFTEKELELISTILYEYVTYRLEKYGEARKSELFDKLVEDFSDRFVEVFNSQIINHDFEISSTKEELVNEAIIRFNIKQSFKPIDHNFTSHLKWVLFTVD